VVEKILNVPILFYRPRFGFWNIDSCVLIEQFQNENHVIILYAVIGNTISKICTQKYETL